MDGVVSEVQRLRSRRLGDVCRYDFDDHCVYYLLDRVSLTASNTNNNFHVCIKRVREMLNASSRNQINTFSKCSKTIIQNSIAFICRFAIHNSSYL